MMANEIELNIRINETGTVQAIENITTNVDKAKDATKQMNDETEKSKDKWTELNAKIEVFQKAINGGIGYLTKFKDTILEMEGFQTQATALSLMSKEGQNLNNVLANSIEITKGVVNQYDIIASVNNLMIKGFDLSSQSLEKLIDVSAIYSSVTGQDVNSVIQRIAMASQREGDMMFEKMGIYVETDRVLEQYAKRMGVAVETLDEATKSSVLLNNALEQMKAKFEETGLSAASLESPITHTYKIAETSIKEAQDAVVGFAAVMYVDLVAATEKSFEKYEEFSERFQAFIQDGFEGRDRVAKKWADRRYAEQQKELLKEIAANEKAEIMKSDNFKLYSDQQLAYGIKNNELIYNNYLAMIKKLQLEQGKTFFISSKLFDIDPTKDKRNLAKEMFFTSDEIDEYMKKSTDKYKDYWDKLQDILKENISLSDSNKYKYTGNELQQEIDKYDKLFDEFIAFSEKKVKHTALYNAQLENLRLKVEQQGLVVNEKQKQIDDKNLKDEEDRKKKEIDLKIEYAKKDYELRMEIVNQNKALDEKVMAENLKRMEKENEEKKKIQDMGNAVFTAAANSVYNDLISGQEDFLQRAAAVALSTAGSQIFADGLKNVWLGGGQILATGGLKGWETVAYGVAEMGAGVALGYAGNQVMPDVASNEGASATEQNKTEQNSYTFNVTASLYGTKKEAQKGLNEVMR